MSITVICSIDLTEEELFHVLLLRHGGATEYPTKSTGPVEADKLVPEADKLVPEADKLVPEADKLVPEADKLVEDYPATEGIPSPRLPKTPRRAKANGAEAPIDATPLAPPPEALDEPAMRSLLSKVGAVHPNKVKAITDLLDYFGGKRRLSECDPATWPAIAQEARKILADYGA